MVCSRCRGIAPVFLAANRQTVPDMTTSQGSAPADKTVPVYQSQTIFQGRKVVLIVHQGREYRLRITNAGKLILTA